MIDCTDFLFILFASQSNIIEGSRRSGRNRKAPVTPQEDPLPSDLSGPDLSSPNESEGEEYAALSADSGEGA